MPVLLPLSPSVAAALYLASAVLFIFAIRGLARPGTALGGNRLGMIGMALAVATTLGLVAPRLDGVTLVMLGGAAFLGAVIGLVLAKRAPMTAMPELVAAFNALGGGASLLTAMAAFYAPPAFGIAASGGFLPARSMIELSISAVLGAVTVTGSFIAFAKLNGTLPGRPLLFPLRHVVNILIGAAVLALVAALATRALPGTDPQLLLLGLVALALLLGVTLIVPIGGADMPVVISMLNSYSGWAAAALGFGLGNFALIIVGALVGSSGAILSYVMCKAMNRSFLSVILGGFGAGDEAGGASAPGADVDRPFRQGSAQDAAFILQNASRVIIVPGYGLAVAQAQHALKEMADLLRVEGVDVSYAIHPVAGRMPGHMNVLLAEANVDYDDIFALEDINNDFQRADVALVIGANDVTNPAAKDDPSSPIYGMPVLNVADAGMVLFVKRSMGTGYSGVSNALFYRDNTMMLLSDGKAMIEGIVKAL